MLIILMKYILLFYDISIGNFFITFCVNHLNEIFIIIINELAFLRAVKNGDKETVQYLLSNTDTDINMVYILNLTIVSIQLTFIIFMKFSKLFFIRFTLCA